jgi:plastocyanin
MRKLVVLTVVAIAALAFAGGAALAAKSPPVSLQGKVTNKGMQTVKKGKVTIEADDFYFKSTFLKANPGTTVTVSLKNEGKTQHTFTIDALGIDQALNAGQKATVKVTLPASGATNFYCRFHGPSGTNQGMQGALFSKTGDAVTTGGGATATPASTAPTPTTTASTSSSGSRSGY